MINAKIISNWLNDPQALLSLELADLKHSALAFPYFIPLQYMRWLHNADSKSSFVDLNEIHPANPVLVYAFFNPLKEEHKGIKEEILPNENNDFFTTPIDYFANQGVEVGYELPKRETLANSEIPVNSITSEAKEKSLMVMMSFAEWLSYLQTKTQKEQEEKEGQKALKAMWQKQKIAEALEEENEEIPDDVFEMAVNSILPEEELISESLANVYAMQGKNDKAIEMFKKLSLRIPEKNAYFALKIKNLQK